jgi:hypothetical protein
VAQKLIIEDAAGHTREVEADKIHEDGHEGRWLVFWNDQDGERLRVLSRNVTEVRRAD